MSTAIQPQAAASANPARNTERSALRPSAYMLLVQGLYYLITGVWPLVSIDTFQRVTGPKTDLWLVDTVGALITVIAVVLLAGVCRRWASAEVILLALGSATALIVIDVVFVTRQVIDRIYLLDAAAESVLILAWLVVLAFEVHSLWKRSDACL
jgi:hypothetical protein